MRATDARAAKVGATVGKDVAEIRLVAATVPPATIRARATRVDEIVELPASVLEDTLEEGKDARAASTPKATPARAAAEVSQASPGLQSRALMAQAVIEDAAAMRARKGLEMAKARTITAAEGHNSGWEPPYPAARINTR